MMLAFVVTYAVTRVLTRRIRRKATSGAVGGVKDVVIGGVHVHHQVWGILLALLAGLLEFRFRPGSPWLEVLAVAFGAGAALALDEFAMWLHLEDVYWSPEGRKSVDAVMVAMVLGALLLLGASPGGASASAYNRSDAAIVVTAVVLVHVLCTVVCLLKGKLVMGLLGFFVPLLAMTGAIRLAKPESFWARRYYRDGKAERAAQRFGEEYRARVERRRDLLSGGRID